MDWLCWFAIGLASMWRWIVKWWGLDLTARNQHWREPVWWTTTVPCFSMCLSNQRNVWRIIGRLSVVSHPSFWKQVQCECFVWHTLLTMVFFYRVYLSGSTATSGRYHQGPGVDRSCRVQRSQSADAEPPQTVDPWYLKIQAFPRNGQWSHAWA